MAVEPKFVLDSRLDADSVLLKHIDEFQVRMIDDARYPWVIIVPERPGLKEIFDLPPEAALRLGRLAIRLAREMKPAFAADKINLGIMGNVIPQLHLHVVARTETDPAWPGSVWGTGQRKRLTETARAARAAVFLRVLFKIEEE